MKTLSIVSVVLALTITTSVASAQLVRAASDGPPTPPADQSLQSPPAAPVTAANDNFGYFDDAEFETASAANSSSAGCDCDAGYCTCNTRKALAKRAAGAYKPLFYDNDFGYLCDPCYDGCNLGENWKAMCVGCNGNLDIGGQLRFRYHHEEGMKGQRFRDDSDDFLLGRMRLYADYQMNEIFRFYVEGIYADSWAENAAPRGIDVNSGDVLNAFVDANLTGSTTLRVGRQELLYGAQRTVSPLDWANTRRTFDGAKLMFDTCDWSVDVFYTNLVTVDPYDFDNADDDQPFYGIYSTYEGYCDATVDFYYLGYENQNTALSAHTFGSRLMGERNDWLYELEGAYQGGSAVGVNTGSQSEGFITAGIGRKSSCHCWEPTVWLYLDYASENYNQLFPLAHKYLGFIDAVQRTNVIAPNVLFKVKPTEKLSLLAWYYHFQAASDGPVPSIGGTPPQNAGRHYGDEIDLLAKYRINARNDLLVGYSHFWKGSKITNTDDADFVYAQWTVNF